MVVLARCRRLQQCELVLSQNVPSLFSLRRERRNPSVWRIDDERRSPADGKMHRVRRLSEFAIDVSLGSPRSAALVALPVDDVGNPVVEFGTLSVCEELLIGVLGGALQRDV